MLRVLLTSLLLSGSILSACSTAPSNTSEPAASIAPTEAPTTSPTAAPINVDSDNLIANAGVETGIDSAPSQWVSDNWGDNTAEIKWVTGDAAEGERYLSIDMADYENGDAKWIPTPTALKPDQWYEYQDTYRSDGRSRLLIFCNKPDGSRFFKNVWQSHNQPKWKANRFRFYSGIYQGCTASVIHVVDRNGYLNTDKHQLKPVEAKPLSRPLVSISFDDIWKTAVDDATPELDRRNWKGSYYITREFTQETDTPEYAKETDIKKLLANGHEIGTHGDIHPRMSTLSANRLEREIKDTYDYVKVLGADPQGIAYPFGDFSEAVEDEVKRYHGYARTSLVGLNDKALNPFRLKIVPVSSETKTSELLNWVDQAEKTKTWVIFLFHDLSDTLGSFEYTTSLSQYKTLLEYVERKNITVLPVNQALKEAQN